MMSDEIDDCNDCNQDDYLINGVHDCDFIDLINECGCGLAVCQVPSANCTPPGGGGKRRSQLYSWLMGSMVYSSYLWGMLYCCPLTGSNRVIYPHGAVTPPFKILNQYIPYYPTISYDAH